jgi:hypothetical protein
MNVEQHNLVFRTFDEITKVGRPFYDLSEDRDIQILNSINTWRILHCDKPCADIVKLRFRWNEKKQNWREHSKKRKKCVNVTQTKYYIISSS